MEYLNYAAYAVLIITILVLINTAIKMSNKLDKSREKYASFIKDVKKAAYGLDEDDIVQVAVSEYGLVTDIENLYKDSEKLEDVERKLEEKEKVRHALYEKYVLILGHVQKIPVGTLKKYKLHYTLKEKARQSRKKK